MHVYANGIDSDTHRKHRMADSIDSDAHRKHLIANTDSMQTW